MNEWKIRAEEEEDTPKKCGYNFVIVVKQFICRYKTQVKFMP
jgi:hypothetical protein